MSLVLRLRSTLVRELFRGPAPIDLRSVLVARMEVLMRLKVAVKSGLRDIDCTKLRGNQPV